MPSKHLQLDALTQSDLEIFTSDTPGTSLYDFCNQAKTEGGKRVLRMRMQQPWCESKKIVRTQKSIRFIQKQRSCLQNLPSAWITQGVENYLKGILPIANHENWFEFTIAAYSLYATTEKHYFTIVRGVQTTCKFIHGLRRFVRQKQLELADGEIVETITEIKQLLKRDNLNKIPDVKLSLGAWRSLRIDRVFRVLEASTLHRLLELVYEIDALVSMADVSSQHRFVLPEVCEGAPHVDAEQVFHPFLTNPVANPVKLNQQHRGLFLTGPNMAGKTTYLRAFATALYFAHLGMGVPAKAFRFVPVEKLFSSISLKDNLHAGVSFFRAEALRVKTIAKAIVEGGKLIVIMDEPFKGTNVKDTFEASLAILTRFANSGNCLFMFSSHQIELSKKLSKENLTIDCRYFSAIENKTRLEFDYRLRQGVSEQRIGMRVLKEEGVFDLFDNVSVENKINFASN